MPHVGRHCKGGYDPRYGMRSLLRVQGVYTLHPHRRYSDVDEYIIRRHAHRDIWYRSLSELDQNIWKNRIGRIHNFIR